MTSQISELSAPSADGQTAEKGSAEVAPERSLAIHTFEDCIEHYSKEVFGFLYRLTGNKADAEDLYQDTLLKAFHAFWRLDDNSNYRAWFYKIAMNAFLSDRRKKERHVSFDEQNSTALAAPAVDFAEKLNAKDLLIEVGQFIATLPPKQRAALILRKYDELDYSDIAETLECSETAARANVYQALRKLQRAFGERRNGTSEFD